MFTCEASGHFENRKVKDNAIQLTSYKPKTANQSILNS